MTIDQIKNELRSFIKEKFEVPDTDSDFSDDVHLFDYGYVDSFGAVELTSFVKTHFGVEITDSDLVANPLNSINEISTFVEKRYKGSVQ